MKPRASAGGLIAVLVALTALGIGGSLIPVRSCVTCAGLTSQMERMATYPSYSPRLDCPDCGDRGKISLFRSWMKPRVSEPVARILRSMPGPGEFDALNVLEEVLRTDGKEPNAFLNGKTGVEFVHIPSRFMAFVAARFIEVGGRTRLILLLRPVLSMNAVSAVLLSHEGQALDCVFVVTGAAGGVELRGGVVDKNPPDRPCVEIAIMVDSGRTDSCRLNQYPSHIREISVKKDSVLRLSVQDDRFEVEPASEK